MPHARKQTRDLAKTFSPVANTVNSECAPLERSFVDGKLCVAAGLQGQLDMELIGEFHFDSPAPLQRDDPDSTAAMAGAQVANSHEHARCAQWVSECADSSRGAAVAFSP